MGSPAVYRVSSDSGRAPGTEHQVWACWLAEDGTSRSRTIFADDDQLHALRVQHALAHPVQVVNGDAAFAATEARGPRCERCGGWTYRPEYLLLPGFVARLCPDCLVLADDLRHGATKRIALSQIWSRDLARFYPNASKPIKLGF